MNKEQQRLKALGMPYVFLLGGGLGIGLILVLGFLALVFLNGFASFYPQPLAVIKLVNGERTAGEIMREEEYRNPEGRKAKRTLLKSGNFDLTAEDYRWVKNEEIKSIIYPKEIFFFERQEWGPFIGQIKTASFDLDLLAHRHQEARQRWQEIRQIERKEIGSINQQIEKWRLKIKKASLDYGNNAKETQEIQKEASQAIAELEKLYLGLQQKAEEIKKIDHGVTLTLASIDGKEKAIPLHQIVRYYPANDLSAWGKLNVYLSRWSEFLSEEPREANTEGGVWPAIFGTFSMTLLMVVFVAPFGVITALYLREYAKQGRIVALVRICVNNLAGVPSIVYGVFGLGFFAYILGGSIDQLFFYERLPNPTFGTGGILWSGLTLALLTVPVVIVATEEALTAVPNSLREGSLACGASKWQTIYRIILPRAMPGILTGLILAMARGAGEVAPLMLVGVVKLAPDLPIDGIFPYLHLERSFMHLGFHIYDVGFQSRNSEAGKPMVFVTTLLLVSLIFAMNLAALYLRGRLKRKFKIGHF